MSEQALVGFVQNLMTQCMTIIEQKFLIEVYLEGVEVHIMGGRVIVCVVMVTIGTTVGQWSIGPGPGQIGG